MNFVAIFMTVFSVLGAIDLIIGNKFGIGKEFEKGFMLLGNLALSMIGMIVISPVIGRLIEPALNVMYNAFNIDPSIIPSMLFACDMGGAPLAETVAKNSTFGFFNGLVVSSMMGCTISFTIPVVLRMVEEKHHKDVILGLLCGIVTIPVGCIAAGLMHRIPVLTLLLNLLPMIIFSGLIALGLVFIPKVCVKIFGVFGIIIKVLITAGLVLGILKFLTGVEVIKGLETFENSALICANAAAVMSGAFPFLYIVSKIISKPMKRLAGFMGIKESAVFGFFSTLASSMTTFEEMKNMDKKGIVLNSAFAVSAAFTLADHLAFTISFNSEYILPMIIGKLISGMAAVFVALVIYKRNNK